MKLEYVENIFISPEVQREVEHYEHTYEYSNDIIVRIINVLLNIGFKLEQPGTYLYEMLIKKILSECLLSDNPLYTEQELQEQLNNPYSQFYFDLARNELDIGIKVFRVLIKSAIENMDYKKNKKQTGYKAKYNRYTEANFGIQAFNIAKFIKNEVKEQEQIQKRKKVELLRVNYL